MAMALPQTASRSLCVELGDSFRKTFPADESNPADGPNFKIELSVTSLGERWAHVYTPGDLRRGLCKVVTDKFNEHVFIGVSCSLNGTKAYEDKADLTTVNLAGKNRCIVDCVFGYGDEDDGFSGKGAFSIVVKDELKAILDEHPNLQTQAEELCRGIDALKTELVASAHDPERLRESGATSDRTREINQYVMSKLAPFTQAADGTPRVELGHPPTELGARLVLQTNIGTITALLKTLNREVEATKDDPSLGPIYQSITTEVRKHHARITGSTNDEQQSLFSRIVSVASGALGLEPPLDQQWELVDPPAEEKKS